jgi:pilus assembly protein FimV
MSRQATPAVIIICALFGTDAFGLELGELRIESALDQPFVGEVDLFDVGADELSTLKVALASADDFAKSGIERYDFLTRLAFRPQMSRRGNPVLRITSREPIREPYMDVLLEVVWPAGRLLKGYTVLLDPPETFERRAAETPAPRIADGRAEPPPDRQASRGGPDGFPLATEPVPRGTTLSLLARSIQPQGATMAQTAMALYRNNQDAFIGGDINRLTPGKTLVIPTEAELFALDAEAAAGELQAAALGRSVRRSPMTEVPRIAAAAKPDAPGAVLTESADAGDDSPSPEIAHGPRQEQGLLGAAQPSQGEPQQTGELRERIEALEVELANLHVLLQQRDTELAQLRDAASAAPPVSETILSAPVSEAGFKQDLVIGTPGVAGDAVFEGAVENLASRDEAAGSSREASAPVDTAAAVSDGDPGPDPADVRTEGDPVVGAVEETRMNPGADAVVRSAWSSHLIPLAGFAGVTALGVGAFALIAARRRRREMTAEDDSPYLDAQALEARESDSVAPSKRPSVVTAKPRGGIDAVPSDRAESEPDLARRREADHALPDPPPRSVSPPHVDAETVEAAVLSEADIYIAYGRYMEAEDLLERAIKGSPERLDLRFKLGEVYAGAGNLGELRKLMASLKASGADQAEPARWQDLGAIRGLVEPDGEAPRDLDASSDEPDSIEWSLVPEIWNQDATKLDLARAYIDMDDVASARDILEEVIAQGREEDRKDARNLLRTIA